MWKCKTCGSVDTYHCNGDNQCCSECGDSEGLEYREPKQAE